MTHHKRKGRDDKRKPRVMRTVGWLLKLGYLRRQAAEPGRPR